MQYASIFLISLAATFLFVPVVKILAVYANIFDVPSSSIKIHERPIPYLGGIAILAGFILSIIYANYLFTFDSTFYLGLVFAAIIISVFGLIDDLVDIKQNYKFITILIIALGVAILGLRVEFIPSPYLAIPITVFYIVGACNAVNNLDGLDGLAAGVSVIAASFFLLLFFENGDLIGVSVSLSLIGTCLAFLRYNFYPASIFMGDAGSLLIGFILSVLMMRYSSMPYDSRAFLIPILICGVPIFDTALTIIRRYIHKKPIFPGDRFHFYDKLIQRGISIRSTVLISYGTGMVFGITSLIMRKVSALFAAVIFVTILVVISIISFKMDLLKTGSE